MERRECCLVLCPNKRRNVDKKFHYYGVPKSAELRLQWADWLSVQNGGSTEEWIEKFQKRKYHRHSPYKAMARRNSNYCGYVSMSVLEPNKAYKIYKVDHTEHDIYGPGELAFIENNRKIKQRVQLPSKYLKELSDEELATLKSDVEQGKFPYLIFRATLPDKSFRIDVLPNGPEMLEFHTTWKDVPDVSELDFLNLESSIETDDGNKEEGSPKTGHDDDLCN